MRARFVIASDGAASRFAKPAGVVRDESRPLGIAARRYYRTDYHPDRGSNRGSTCGRATSCCRATVALPGGGRHDQPGRRAAEHVQELQGRLRAATVQRVRDDAAAVVRRVGGDRRGPPPLRAAPDELQPYRRRRSRACCWSATPQGAVNPFNGEGIAYAMETGEMAADMVHEALVQHRPGLTMSYPRRCVSATAGTSRSAAGSREPVGKPDDHGPRHALHAAPSAW